MDTIGAVGGAGLALIWLIAYPGEYEMLFLIAFIPGLLSIAFTLFLQKDKPSTTKAGKYAFRGIFSFWKQAPSGYRNLLLAGIAFALLNSSDILLLLRAGDAGMKPFEVVGLYLFYNIVYVLASFPLGGLADRIGFKPVYVLSIVCYGISYLGIALATETWMIWAVFGIYGFFAASNEGIVTAWLTLFIPKEKKGTGLGLFSFFETIAKFVASPALGLLWVASSSQSAFAVVGVAALLLGVSFLLFLPSKAIPKK
jgi:MFS family permease